MDRHEWLKAVLQSHLPPKAKVVAAALALEFWDDPAPLSDRARRIAQYLKVTEYTVYQAFGRFRWFNLSPFEGED